MNPWLLTAIIIACVAFVFLIVSIVAAVIGLKNVFGQLLEIVNRLQKEQVQPLLDETLQLNETINTLKTDIAHKKQEIDYVIQSVKGVNTQLTDLNEQSRAHALAIVKKVQTDPVRQAQTAQWTNKAMGFLNKVAK